MTRILARRRVWIQARRYFQLAESAGKVVYPIVMADGSIHPRGRVKYVPPRRGRKYSWTGNPSVPAPAVYHEAGLEHAKDGTLIVASGEVEVWVLWQIGLRWVVSFFGEGRIPPRFAATISRYNIQRVVVYPDRDQAGVRAAARLRDCIADVCAFAAFRLPFDDESGGDLGAWWQTFAGSGRQFAAAMQNLPPLVLPPPQPRCGQVVDMSAGHVRQSPVWDAYIAAITEALGLHERSFNAAGWSISAISSPMRKDQHPSATWHRDGWLYDHAQGTAYSAKQVGEAIGLPWEQFRRQKT